MVQFLSEDRRAGWFLVRMLQKGIIYWVFSKTIIEQWDIQHLWLGYYYILQYFKEVIHLLTGIY